MLSHPTSKQLASAAREGLEQARKCGRVIAASLNRVYKCSEGDGHGYYIHNYRLYITYPSYFYAMDREVTAEDVTEALDGLTPDASTNTIDQAIASYFGI